MGSNRQQARAKAARERTVRERRERKLEKKRVAAAERKGRTASAAEARADGDAASTRMTMELAVGDLVVYRNHGIGRVAARREQVVLGGAQEVVVLELEELTVTLPLALARTRLRPLVNAAELRGVGDALRDDSALNSRNWLSRRPGTLEKLAGGTPVDLAEIVSEGAQRERLPSASGGKRHLSVSEREVFTKARRLLSDEIALALDIQPTAAESWIDRHLERPDSGS